MVIKIALLFFVCLFLINLKSICAELYLKIIFQKLVRKQKLVIWGYHGCIEIDPNKVDYDQIEVKICFRDKSSKKILVKQNGLNRLANIFEDLPGTRSKHKLWRCELGLYARHTGITLNLTDRDLRDKYHRAVFSTFKAKLIALTMRYCADQLFS